MASAAPPPRTLKELGVYLRERRQAAGLTQKQVMKAIDEDDVRNVSRWENGRNEPKALSFLNLISALGVELSPRPPKSIPKAVNEELRLLRESQERALDVLDALAQRLEDVVQQGSGRADPESEPRARPGRQ